MAQKTKILIIEDDADISKIIVSFLQRHDFDCLQAFSGSEAFLLLRSMKEGSAETPDIVICDLMLPGYSGKEIVTHLRETASIPIIMISANDTPSTKVELLNLGADDYLAKPFDLEELLARIQVQLRRIGTSPESLNTSAQGILRFKDWELDTRERLFKSKDQAIKLTRLEYNIIEALIEHPRKVFSKQELYRLAWQEDYAVDETSISVHVSNIRTKLKATETDGYIETVWGIGFKLVS